MGSSSYQMWSIFFRSNKFAVEKQIKIMEGKINSSDVTTAVMEKRNFQTKSPPYLKSVTFQYPGIPGHDWEIPLIPPRNLFLTSLYYYAGKRGLKRKIIIVFCFAKWKRKGWFALLFQTNKCLKKNPTFIKFVYFILLYSAFQLFLMLNTKVFNFIVTSLWKKLLI